MARFFISYSRSIKDDVHKIINLLRASGHEVWWDGDIPIMADWWATILDHIEWCDIFIFIASEKSVESPYCLAELRYANERGRLILPLIWESPDTFSLPAELPHRNQWLIFDGEPVTMLGQINTAYGLIDGNYPQDIEAQRPPEPNTGETSIIKQYQEALKLAYAMDFEQAKRILRNLKRLDPKGWGKDCDKWLAQINTYAPLVELVDHESTYERASQGWLAYVRQYGLEFDPYQIEDKIRQYQVNHQLNQHPTVPISEPTTNQTSKSLFGILSVLGIFVVGMIAFIIFQNIGNNDHQLANPTEIAVIPTDEPAQLSTVSTEVLVIDQPLSVDEIALSTINARATEIESNNQVTSTAQTEHNLQATATAFSLTQSAEQTRHAIEVETRVIELQATLTTWTPTPTQTSTFTLTPTNTNTQIATHTLRPPTNVSTTTLPKPTEITIGSLGEVLMFDGRFNSLIELVLFSGLTDLLFGTDNYTVFSPTDEALGANTGFMQGLMDSPIVAQSILHAHIVEGIYTIEDLTALEGELLTLLEGAPLTFSVNDEEIIVLNNNEARIIETIPTSNGIIHVIDTIISEVPMQVTSQRMSSR